MAIREHWAIPRTFDRTDSNATYWHLIAHLDPVDQRKQIGRWAKGIRQTYIPPRQQDMLVKLMLSALPIGERKGGPGDKRLCTHTACKAHDHMENILHTFRDCKLASDTLDHIFAAWHTATGETLDNKCIRTVIFGDRQPKQSNTSPELEEPYRMIQAHLMHSLWRARCQRAHPDTRRGKELRSTTAAILQDIRTGVQAQLTCRYEEAREMNLI